MTQNEPWTAKEIHLVRRSIAYHQKRSLRTISDDDARVILDEQQRRQNKLFSDGARYYRNGWWCAAGEVHPCAAPRIEEC